MTGLAVLALSVLGVLGGDKSVRAQFQMPDPKQMAGIPRPVSDLPNGTVSVRLARARNLLGSRLARRGLTVASAALSALLAEGAATATARERGALTAATSSWSRLPRRRPLSSRGEIDCCGRSHRST